jgi:hypothetical protein
MKLIKNIFVIIFASLVWVQCSNEDISDTFQKDLDAYLQYTNSSDWNSLLDMTYPKVFELSSREQMLAAMQQMEASGMKITTTRAELKNVSELMELEGAAYMHLSYEGDVQIAIGGILADKSGIIFSQLKDSYGEGKVKFDEVNNRFDIDAEKSMVAVSTDSKKTWKYFEYNESQKAILPKLFPTEVVEKINAL